MNQASFFIEKVALFGGYPNHKQIKELQDEGVVWFIDLTSGNEKNIKVYSHLVNNWINYPIKDGCTPESKKTFLVFLLLLKMVLQTLKPGEKLYLHCRGGHGRSSLVISCFLSMVLNIPPIDSINMVKKYHNLRPNLKQKWIRMAPLNLQQHKFVENFFGTIHLYTNFRHDMVNCTKKIDLFKYMVMLNFYIHQNPYMLEVLLNSGLKKIEGEGLTSLLLQELRLYILYTKAIKIFTTVNK